MALDVSRRNQSRAFLERLSSVFPRQWPLLSLRIGYNHAQRLGHCLWSLSNLWFQHPHLHLHLWHWSYRMQHLIGGHSAVKNNGWIWDIRRYRIASINLYSTSHRITLSTWKPWENEMPLRSERLMERSKSAYLNVLNHHNSLHFQ